MDELYILARSVLLDALTALGEHREAVVLVGAQAIYRRVGEADIAVAPFTTDADLAINPTVLSKAPPIEAVLREAGFKPKSEDAIGVWVKVSSSTENPHIEVPIDLLTPRFNGPWKRAALRETARSSSQCGSKSYWFGGSVC